MTKEKRNLLWIAFGIGSVGWALLIWQAGWKIALAIAIVLWCENLNGEARRKQ